MRSRVLSQGLAIGGDRLPPPCFSCARRVLCAAVIELGLALERFARTLLNVIGLWSSF
jgi:hypothetical protein